MITIKKYSNRRLYNTESSSYINLEQLTELIRGGEKVEVVDARNGDDLTGQVLLQVILEQSGAVELLPTSLLHRVIRHTDDTPYHRMAVKQLAAGLELLERQMGQVEQQMSWMKSAGGGIPGMPPMPGFPGFGTDAAASAKAPGKSDAASQHEPTPEPEPDAEPEVKPVSSDPPPDAELDALRARLEALEGRLKR